MALLFFNVGVEIGQLLFIATALPFGIDPAVHVRPALGRLGGALRHRQHRHVLGDRTCRRILTGGHHAAKNAHDENVIATLASRRLDGRQSHLAGLGARRRLACEENLEQALPKPAYSPYADRDFPTRPFFGDTHLHTSFSMDAGAFGARLNPRDAYRFARGEQVTSSTGQPKPRALDFLVVADHSDNMGFFPDLFAGKPDLLADPTGRKWYDMIQSGKGAEAAIEIIVAFSHGTFPKDIMYFPGTRAYRSAWQETIAAAEHFNEPGRFTAFIGYEWTSNTGGNNLHRNVIFRDNGDKASQVEPFTVYPPYGSDNPVELWKWMEAYEKKTGGSVLAIAHNGNLSNGTMFPVVEAFGKRLDREYAEQRRMGAALRGHPDQGHRRGPSVPVAERRVRRLRDLGQGQPRRQRCKEEMLEFEYARSAYKNGLKLEQQLGTNPYKFGLIGSSDAHRSHRDGGGQLFRQDRSAGAEPASHGPPLSTIRRPA